MIRRSVIVILMLLIPLLLFLPGISGFVYPYGSAFSDLSISHFPNLVYLKQSLADGNGIPLWSNTILSGFPFAANPLSGLWYPPGWLLLVMPLPLGFNLMVILHMFWGGLGMYLLLRQRQVQMLPALGGALAFELFPKMFAHFGAGHITLLFAVAWTPWLLLSEHHQTYASGKTIKLIPAVLLGIILLADVRWGLYAGLLWFLYSLHLLFPDGYSGRTLPRWIKTSAAQVIVAGLIAAPLLLPLLEYTRLSTRHTLTSEENLILALPLSGILGFLYPDLAGYAEWTVYPGALALLLLVWSIFHPELRNQNRFWIGAVVLTLLVALGPGVPIIGTVLKYVVRLPLLNLLRVPTRAVFIMGLAFGILLADALESLSKAQKPVVTKKWFHAGPVLVGITAFAVLLSSGIYIIGGEISPEFGWGALALTVFCFLILLRQSGRISGKVWLMAALPLLVLDMAGVGFFQVGFRKTDDVLSEGKAAADYLSLQDGLFRVYSPSYSLPQQTAAVHGLQLADGIDPIVMRSYTQFMDDATGVPRNGYRVTLPPMDGDDVSQANRNYQPDARSLGLLNVRYVAAEFPLEVYGLRFQERIGSTWIYENEYALPRAWIQSETEVTGKNIQPVHSLRSTANRIEILAPGPGLLVLSELFYPGWQVQVNGEKTKIQPVMNLFRGVQLTQPENQVVFTFRPLSVYAGLALSLLGWFLVLLSMRKVSIAE
jgi:hypothetical protein